MNISQQEIQKLGVTFLGCGNINAPIWFIGMEPGACESCLSLEENARIRISSFGEKIGLSEAHHLLKEDNQKLSQVWLFASKIVRSITKVSDWDDTIKAKEFAHTKFGIVNGITLAVELLPLPRSDMKIWPEIYKELFPNYETYKEIILKERLEFLRKKISIHKPKFIFAYGKGNYNDYHKLSDTKTKWINLSNLLNDHLLGRNLSFVAVGISDKTIYVLLPFLGNGWISKKDIEVITDYLKNSFPNKIQEITTI